MISVVMPVYNGQNYIFNALESICKQTYRDLEIIVVDDGSTDASREIVYYMAANDSRIKLISQENSGPSKARNTGIVASTGEFVAFVDADDILPENYFEELLKAIQGNDMAVCGLELHNRNEIIRIIPEERNYNLAQYISSSLKGDLSPLAAFTGPVAKLFRKEILDKNDLKFNVAYRYGEDTVFNLAYLAFCDSISTVPYTYYRVNEQECSLSKSINPERFLAYRDIKKGIRNLLEQTGLSNTGIVVNESMYFVDNFFARAGEILNTNFDKRWKESQLTALLSSGIVTPDDIIKARGTALPWKMLSVIVKLKKGKALLLWFIIAPRLGV